MAGRDGMIKKRETTVAHEERLADLDQVRNDVLEQFVKLKISSDPTVLRPNSVGSTNRLTSP
eukprot:4580081-Prymnesium_polylepis.1